MRLSLITEHRFERTPDGRVWTTTANAYSFWARYLAVFDEVNVTARLCEVATMPCSASTSLPAANAPEVVVVISTIHDRSAFFMSRIIPPNRWFKASTPAGFRS